MRNTQAFQAFLNSLKTTRLSEKLLSEQEFLTALQRRTIAFCWFMIECARSNAQLDGKSLESEVKIALLESVDQHVTNYCVARVIINPSTKGREVKSVEEKHLYSGIMHEQLWQHCSGYISLFSEILLSLRDPSDLDSLQKKVDLFIAELAKEFNKKEMDDLVNGDLSRSLSFIQGEIAQANRLDYNTNEYQEYWGNKTTETQEKINGNLKSIENCHSSVMSMLNSMKENIFGLKPVSPSSDTHGDSLQTTLPYYRQPVVNSPTFFGTAGRYVDPNMPTPVGSNLNDISLGIAN